MESFRNRLKNLCADKFETEEKKQNEIAADLDMSPQALSYLINKGQKPSPKSLKKMASYFNVTPEFLLGKSNIKVPEEVALEDFGLDTLKSQLDRCAGMDTDLINTLNRVFADTLVKLKDLSGGIDIKALNAIDDALQEWCSFIETAGPSDNAAGLERRLEKEMAKNSLYAAVESIKRALFENGKTIINRLYPDNNNNENEGETDGND
jgi:transcriptional regulator with XRE-family HTH domain